MRCERKINKKNGGLIVKKKLLTIIALLLMVVAAGSLLAEDKTAAPAAKAPAAVSSASVPQAAGITIDTVIQAVEKGGLKNVKSIETEDGQWEVETQNANMEVKYALNPQTSQLAQIGQDTENDPQPADLSSLQKAVQAVQGKSYIVIGIEFKGTAWEVKAYDNQGQEFKILVNKDSGEILNTQMDD
jgi:hypothetical protein